MNNIDRQADKSVQNKNVAEFGLDWERHSTIVQELPMLKIW